MPASEYNPGNDEHPDTDTLNHFLLFVVSANKTPNIKYSSISLHLAGCQFCQNRLRLLTVLKNSPFVLNKIHTDDSLQKIIQRYIHLETQLPDKKLPENQLLREKIITNSPALKAALHAISHGEYLKRVTMCANTPTESDTSNNTIEKQAGGEKKSAGDTGSNYQKYFLNIYSFIYHYFKKIQLPNVYSTVISLFCFLLFLAVIYQQILLHEKAAVRNDGYEQKVKEHAMMHDTGSDVVISLSTEKGKDTVDNTSGRIDATLLDNEQLHIEWSALVNVNHYQLAFFRLDYSEQPVLELHTIKTFVDISLSNFLADQPYKLVFKATSLANKTYQAHYSFSYSISDQGSSE